MAISCSSAGFCILPVILFLCFGSVIGGGNETDKQALLAIKEKITKDPCGILSSWNASVHFCQWPGVACGRKHQRVTILRLESQKLVGSISPCLGNLSFLRIFSLWNNSFSGEIPPEIGLLRRLQVLYLGDNLLGGQIPTNISGCSNLVTISLGFNGLVGRIPENFRFLLKINSFVVESNNLAGEIPQFFGNFSSLEEIAASDNNFGGSIPDALGRLNKLYFLGMGENNLFGIIPPSLYNLSSMTIFEFSQNQLEGTFPSEFGNIFPRLKHFNIGGNKFTGSIPVSLSNASNLVRFIIDTNKISGNLPSLEKLHKLFSLSMSRNQLGTGQAGDLNFVSTISNATSFGLLDISFNNFGGTLPSSITNLTSLGILALDVNQITGPIPAGLGNLFYLEILDVGDNYLRGDIPEEFGKLKQLKMLHLGYNNFSGNIPSSFGNLTQLIKLFMYENNLWGSIPPNLGKCQNLNTLNLGGNKLGGVIPKEVMSIPSISIHMDLSENYLTGSLPAEIGTMKNLGSLLISDNMLSGEIPSSLGLCVSLESLYMQRNFFHGIIPVSLSSLKAIQELDFSHNNLTGKIPVFFENLHLLRMLNLSFNDFEGIVPEEGVFKNSTAVSVVGNSKLCGGIVELMLPPCDNKDTKKGSLTLAVKLVIAACGILCAAFFLSSVFLLLIKRKRAESKTNPSMNQLPLMSYQSLHKATHGFSSTCLLGVGSFGCVYKGILDGDRKVIAVKVLNLLRQGAFKSFKAECEVLRNAKHRNLVKILTACSSIDFQGNDFKALVYEFMVNGSLEEWLHPIHRTINEAQESTRSLNFLCRLSIAIDVASALQYLHHSCQTPIIHCDLKPSNVLLDDEMIGHVGDFGLARFFTESVDNNSDIQSSTIEIRGTIGYTAPEYGMGNGVSILGDVHAYGVMLLEIFTGKRPTDEMFKDGLNLHTYAKAALQEHLVEKILDPILFQDICGIANNDPDRESCIINSEVKECISSIFGVGVSCSAELPGERMNISLVADKLLAIKEKLFKINSYTPRTQVC